MRYLIRDRDGKFPASFDSILADTGIKAVLTGVRVPRMSSIIKRWMQSCRHELLDRMLVWSQAHLLHALQEYERHYNTHRPHRGISSARPLRPVPDPIPTLTRSRTSTSGDATAWAASPRIRARRMTCMDEVFGTRRPRTGART